MVYLAQGLVVVVFIFVVDVSVVAFVVVVEVSL